MSQNLVQQLTIRSLGYSIDLTIFKQDKKLINYEKNIFITITRISSA